MGHKIGRPNHCNCRDMREIDKQESYVKKIGQEKDEQREKLIFVVVCVAVTEVCQGRGGTLWSPLKPNAQRHIKENGPL